MKLRTSPQSGSNAADRNVARGGNPCQLFGDSISIGAPLAIPLELRERTLEKVVIPAISFLSCKWAKV